MTTAKKNIFYFEEDPESLRHYCEALRAKYEVTIGAHRELIEQPRQQPVDLVIVDLMIPHFSFDEEGKEVESIRFQDVNWQLTGVEFLKRLRAGEYQEFGLPRQVPVIVATALVDYAVHNEVEKLNIEAYLEKPFTVDELERAVDAVLSSNKGEA